MVGLSRALEKARAAIESIYDGKATISEYKPVKDPVTKRTTPKEVVVLNDQPCHLVFRSVPVSDETNTGTKLNQIIKLHIAPELMIKSGSKITVTQKGRTVAYKNSSASAVYSTHQEIVLALFKDWA